MNQFGVDGVEDTQKLQLRIFMGNSHYSMHVSNLFSRGNKRRQAALKRGEDKTYPHLLAFTNIAHNAEVELDRTGKNRNQWPKPKLAELAHKKDKKANSKQS